MPGSKPKSIRGRGAVISPDPRYSSVTREPFSDGWDDGWDENDEAPVKIRTTITEEHPKSVINKNNSPDLPFELSINPFRGCEHGCVYCYARPAHAYIDLSPGLDFESKLFAKPDAPGLLRKEIAKSGYRCSAISLGANTDAYQPIERKLGITRRIIEVLAETNHPLTIVSKSSLVERDIDLLQPMAAKQLVQVFISVTTLSRELARKMEPRAAAPQRRLETIHRLAHAGIPAGVMVAPVIPGLTESEIEVIVGAASDAGATFAGYVMLRLPREVRDLFSSWLETNYPLKHARVMSMIRDVRDGRDNDAKFGRRLRGTGPIATLIKSRFEKAVRDNGLNRSRHDLRTDLFTRPRPDEPQLPLF